jgi:hypothetical protein
VLRPRSWSRGSTPEEPASEAIAPDEPAADDNGGNADEYPAPRRGWLAAWQDRTSAPAAVDDAPLKPSSMRGNEALYGYLVGLELIAVSILNLVVTHGKGAPAHPSTGLAVIGLVASIAATALVRTHHRLIAPLALVVAAFFVTLPRGPDSLGPAHIFALIIPVVYAFFVTREQRKATQALTRAGRSGAAKTTTAKSTPADRRAGGAGGRRGRKQAVVPTGPAASSRYTPPKAKRRKPAPPPEKKKA